MRSSKKPTLNLARKHGKPASIPAGKFKTHCLELMDQVKDSGCEIVITKRGSPVAKLVPFEERQPDIFGYLKGTVSIRGDIVGPTGEVWDAAARYARD